MILKWFKKLFHKREPTITFSHFTECMNITITVTGCGGWGGSASKEIKNSFGSSGGSNAGGGNSYGSFGSGGSHNSKEGSPEIPPQKMEIEKI